MTTGQFLIIIIFTSFTGWLIAGLIIRILFWPIRPVNIAGFKIHGIIPAKKKHLANGIANQVQSAFNEYKGLNEKIADPILLEKLKPKIEEHVDHFLKEKLKTVFPLLAQFMGEKTISQFKTAFLIEIDNLFPVLMKDYVNDLKQELRLDNIITEKIEGLSLVDMKQSFYAGTISERRSFKVLCTGIGLLSGIILALLLMLVNI